MTDIELAWLSGLFEGEGCIATRRAGTIVLSIQMTDEDVVRRCAQVAGVGTISGPVIHRNRHAKPIWRWHVTRCDDAARLVEGMLPWLGSRRSKKAVWALEQWRERLSARPPARLKTRCANGHAYTPENTRIKRNGARACRACARARSMAAYISGTDWARRNPQKARVSSRERARRYRLRRRNAA